ncbi:MAG: serine/threonine protein kinase [Planctomycetaceae bacterium]|nr:serine/threonine protein kinase [Planctomycetaceae bacterium]
MDSEQVGPFQLLKRLGSKRQRVYAARHLEQQRVSAIKLIAVPPHLTRDEALHRIHKEVRFLSRLRHPGLVQMLGGGVSHDQIYLEMEMVEGESLSSILARRGRLEWDVAVQFAIEIAEVLGYLHSKGLTHGKLTPEKILIVNGKVKVSDLRLNRIRRRRWDAQKRAELEVAAYLAPEQLLGKGVSPQADLYALGVIIYELVTGQLPFPPESLKQMTARKQTEVCQAVSLTIVEVPTWLDQVLMNLTNPDPRVRYPSAAAALMALREIQKVEANKISAVAQMAAGFNPLNAGVDKREARELLGQFAEPPRPTKSWELSLSIPFGVQIAGLILGLIVSVAILLATVVSLTPTLSSRISLAHQVLAKDQPSLLELGTTIDQLKTMIDRSPTAIEIPAAVDLVQELETRRLLRLAEIGRPGNSDELTRRFIKAFQLAENENYYAAIEGYYSVLSERTTDTIDIDFLFREAERQVMRCKRPYAEQVRQQLALTRADRAVAAQLAIEAHKVLGAETEYDEWLEDLALEYPEIKSIAPWPTFAND